jgi:hypothetical protein
LKSTGEEVRVSDHSQAITAAIVGAVSGAVVAYLLFTDKGRKLRRELEGVLEDTAAELNSLRATVEKTADLAIEGWKLLNDAIGESEPQPPRYSGPRQTAPF